MVTVGFDPTTYSVNEVDGFVELSVLLLQGTLERDITFSSLHPRGLPLKKVCVIIGSVWYVPVIYD